MLRNITSLLFCYLTTEQRKKLYKGIVFHFFDYDFIATYIYIYILFVPKRDTKTARKDFLIRNEGSDFSNRNSRTVFLSLFRILSLNSNLNIRLQINPAINSIELLLDLSINELDKFYCKLRNFILVIYVVSLVGKALKIFWSQCCKLSGRKIN